MICLQSDANATALRAAMCRNPVPDHFSTRPLGCSPTTNQQQFFALRHLRKLLPTSFRRNVIFTVESRDPLEVRLFILFPLRLTSCQWSPCSALLPCPDSLATHLQNRSPLSYILMSVNVISLLSTPPSLTLLQSPPLLPISQSSTLASNSIISSLRNFSNRYIRAGHSLPPIEVPLAAGYSVCSVYFHCCQRSHT